MPFDAPFMLGPFLVDAQGRLAPRDPEALPAFLVRWRGRLIRARLRPSQSDLGRLLLRSVLGRVPSTADGADPALRPNSFAALRCLPRNLPAGWCLSLLPDHSVVLEAGADLPLPITASGLVAKLTSFLLRLGPYLDLLEELGVFDASAAAGTLKI